MDTSYVQTAKDEMKGELRGGTAVLIRKENFSAASPYEFQQSIPPKQA